MFELSVDMNWAGLNFFVRVGTTVYFPLSYAHL